MMKVFVITGFEGHWPVGTAAVIVARNKTQARGYLIAEARKRGLHLDATDLPPESFQEISVTMPGCLILNDGNY